MATILVECVQLRATIAKLGHQTSQTLTKTESGRIRDYVDEISEYDYGKAIRVIRRDRTLATGRELQTRYEEAIYWKIILKSAKLIHSSSLPSAKGSADGFTMAEKAASKKFMRDAGYGASAENQRQYRILWKTLFQLREAGAEKVLNYRTRDFDCYCKWYRRSSTVSLVQKIPEWENVYRCNTDQPVDRAIKLTMGDLKRRSSLDNPQVASRLELHEVSWNNATNEWADAIGKESFKSRLERPSFI